MVDDTAPLPITVWSDYICPWCYLGRDRSAVLRAHGADVTLAPYELHPDIPPGGRAVRPEGRVDSVHHAIARECAEIGMPFRPPTHVPNSRLALETAEAVRATSPNAFTAFDDALFRAHFVEGVDIGEQAVLDRLVCDAGADPASARDAREADVGSAALERSMAAAREHGIAATPAWLLPNGFVIPGVQPRDLFVRVVTRLRARSGDEPVGPGT